MTMKSIETNRDRSLTGAHRTRMSAFSFRSFFSETHTVFQFSPKKWLFAKRCSNFQIGAALLLSFRCLWRMVYSTPKLTNVASNLSAGHEGLWASGAGRRCGAATVAGRRRPTPASEVWNPEGGRRSSGEMHVGLAAVHVQHHQPEYSS